MMEERMGLAVVQACRALRQRHREEEGAHGPALAALFTALSRPPVMTSPFMLASLLHQIAIASTETLPKTYEPSSCALESPLHRDYQVSQHFQSLQLFAACGLK